jgi:hypothetical protein
MMRPLLFLSNVTLLLRLASAAVITVAVGQSGIDYNPSTALAILARYPMASFLASSTHRTGPQ